MLVHRAKRAQRYVILDDDVTGKRGCIGHDAVIAHYAVVTDVRAGHQQAVGAEARNAAATHSSATHGYVLANGVVVADDRFGRLTAILQILRRHANRRERIDGIARTNAGSAVHYDV